jgi:hypothetical protein
LKRAHGLTGRSALPGCLAPDNPAGIPGPIAVFSARMFDLVKPQIATAADKLTHLRRFL